ncbi:hypothetical protein DFS34DRAFT_239563 [Phlyctochytrium arcticum]|nr:hypothetical protein DFS34DRAFT_239563 [Phlyctochytrium arcticum]
MSTSPRVWGDQHGGTFETPYYYTLADLTSHAERTGLTEADEEEALRRTVKLVGRVYRRMRLPAKTFATSSYLLHRFYAVWPRKSPYYTEEEICLACMDMACKLEETTIGLAQLSQYVLCEHRGERLTETEAKSAMEGKLAPHQQKILESIQFDLNMRHPFPFCARFIKLLAADHRLSPSISLKAYRNTLRIILDTYRIPLSIQFPAHIIAMSSILVASKFFKDIPSIDSEFAEDNFCSIDIVEDVCVQILRMYTKLPEFEKIATQAQKYLSELEEKIKNKPPPLKTSPASPDPGYSADSLKSPHIQSPVRSAPANGNIPADDRPSGENKPSSHHSSPHHRTYPHSSHPRHDASTHSSHHSGYRESSSLKRRWTEDREDYGHERRNRDRDRNRERDTQGRERVHRDREDQREREPDRDRDRNGFYREYDEGRRRNWR